MEAAATLRREIRFCFFGIDWDLKPEINIHTLHRTEHLVAIYFKGKVIFSTRVGQVGGSGDLVCMDFSYENNVYQFWLMLLRGKSKNCWWPLLGEETFQILSHEGVSFK